MWPFTLMALSMRSPDVVQWCQVLALNEAQRYRLVGDWNWSDAHVLQSWMSARRS
jgi:hypothetical protein